MNIKIAEIQAQFAVGQKISWFDKTDQRIIEGTIHHIDQGHEGNDMCVIAPLDSGGNMAIIAPITQFARGVQKAQQITTGLNLPHEIYVLTDPRDRSINYVGISTNIARRYKQHCQCHGTNLELNLWIQDLLRNDFTPVLTVIESVVGTNVAQERESHWIQHYAAENAPLKNIAKAEQDGGTRIDDPIIAAMIQAGLLEGYHG